MMDARIQSITAREVRDSRGVPTISVRVVADGKVGECMVPSGASTGAHEAYELRDGDAAYANGKGVFKAIANVNNIIAPLLIGQPVSAQKKIDDVLIEKDGTDNKSVLGGNALIGVSVAAAKAAAQCQGVPVFAYLRSLAVIQSSRPLPYLYMNLINGGKHAKSRLAFQEYHVVPMIDSVAQALEIGIAMQAALERKIKNEFGERALVSGDEGGFALDVASARLPLELLASVARELHYENKVRFALDVAASSFYDGKKYAVDGKAVSEDEFFGMYAGLMKDFNLLSIEDPFAEEDFGRFARLAAQYPSLLVIGDDLTVTNVGRLKKAIGEKSIGGIIIKPNQIGTVSETIEAIALARAHHIHCVVSHRSGETMDDFIADLAVAFGCFGIKAGAPRPAERMAKYNRLCAIEKAQGV